MKRMLALILCVMLLVGAVPTAAFAEDENNAVEAINLAPAYEALGMLYAAYGEFAAAYALKNNVELFQNNIELFLPKVLGLLPAVLTSQGWEADEINNFMQGLTEIAAWLPAVYGMEYGFYITDPEWFLAEYPNGISVETLFSIFGAHAAEGYNLIGNLLAVGSTELAIDTLTLGVYDNLNSIFNEFGLGSAQPTLNEPVIFDVYNMFE